MLPFGHLSVSYLSGTIFKKAPIPALLMGGILPDIDFLFINYPFFNHIHRLWTHNFLFILLAAVIIGGLFNQPYRFKAISGLFIGGLLHLVIDACMDANPTNGIGVPFLWPFDSTCFSPFNLLKLSDSTSGWNDKIAMIKLSLYGLLYEIPLYIASLLVFVQKREKRIRTAAPPQ
jgi:membrane-bound metal-dependent hydrolase YbcI (DUF457 family)